MSIPEFKTSILNCPDTIDEITEEIRKGKEMINQCVGTLYPNIVWGDINILDKKRAYLYLESNKNLKN